MRLHLQKAVPKGQEKKGEQRKQKGQMGKHKVMGNPARVKKVLALPLEAGAVKAEQLKSKVLMEKALARAAKEALLLIRREQEMQQRVLGKEVQVVRMERAVVRAVARAVKEALLLIQQRREIPKKVQAAQVREVVMKKAAVRAVKEVLPLTRREREIQQRVLEKEILKGREERETQRRFPEKESRKVRMETQWM